MRRLVADAASQLERSAFVKVDDQIAALHIFDRSDENLIRREYRQAHENDAIRRELRSVIPGVSGICPCGRRTIGRIIDVSWLLPTVPGGATAAARTAAGRITAIRTTATRTNAGVDADIHARGVSSRIMSTDTNRRACTGLEATNRNSKVCRKVCGCSGRDPTDSANSTGAQGRNYRFIDQHFISLLRLLKVK
ncbi:hypothetical protein BMI87_18780 [Thioclava sp. F28-4]|nr:hypothetical protein BMI87_18780 [Thioclava sp. F28-4]